MIIYKYNNKTGFSGFLPMFRKISYAKLLVEVAFCVNGRAWCPEMEINDLAGILHYTALTQDKLLPTTM